MSKNKSSTEQSAGSSTGQSTEQSNSSFSSFPWLQSFWPFSTGVTPQHGQTNHATASPLDFLNPTKFAASPELGQGFVNSPSFLSMGGVLDPETLKKRIEELKHVEQWLVFNLNCLRGTIQSMEVQVATLAAMQSFSQTVEQAMKNFMPPSDNHSQANDAKSDSVKPEAVKQPAASKDVKDTKESAHAATENSEAASDNTINPWWNLMQQQFTHILQQSMPVTAASDDAVSEKQDDKVKSDPTQVKRTRAVKKPKDASK